MIETVSQTAPSSPSPPVANTAPGATTWEVQGRVTLVMVPPRDPKGADVTLTIRGSGPGIRQAYDRGLAKAEALRNHVTTEAAASADAKAWKRETDALDELVQDRSQMAERLTKIDQELTEAITAKAAAKVAKENSELKARIDTLDIAITHAKFRRDVAARTLHRAAEEIARAAQKKALLEIDTGRLAAQATSDWTSLVELEPYFGFIASGLWPAVVAKGATEKIIGGPIPLPPLPPPEPKPAIIPPPLPWGTPGFLQ